MDRDAGGEPERRADARAGGRRRAADLAPWPSLCLFFDDADPAALAGTRDLWKRWKAEGHEVRYFRQGERGAWEQAG